MSMPTHKAINFDLNTNAMKSIGEYPNGYKKLGASYEENQL